MGKCSLFSMGLWAVMLQLLVLLGRSVRGGADAWDDITSLELMDGESLKRVVYPLVEMSANAYRYPAVISIEGWSLVDAVAPIHGGMHALVYKDDIDTGRMVLAFRGTDITGSESSIADLCADKILWGEQSLIIPDDCSQFSSDTLDYYKQAVDYTQQVLRAHPQASLLLTGHSLGAGLAVLTTATFSTNPLLPVIAFSAAGTKTVLETRSLKLTADHDKKLYIIADKWDEIMRTDWKNQVGTLCFYETSIPEDCTVCFGDAKDPARAGLLTYRRTLHGPDLQSDTTQLTAQHLEGNSDVPALVGLTAECWNCFLETHYMRHVIDLVELGNKPVCEFRSSTLI